MDLHDQTLADLTRLVRRLEQVGQSGAVPAEALEPVVRGLHGCMQDLRQIIEAAKPSVLQLFGFADAVENHLDRSVRDSGQALDWRLVDDSGGAFDRLDPNVSVTLFRIVQEAVNNAVRHAGPRGLRVRLSEDAEQAVIVVADDGRGLTGRRVRRGSGIDNMKTRARLISARFALEPGADGTGTQVTIRLAAEAREARVAAE